MCKAKTQGGRRCNYHLTSGVTSAMTTYATAVTGLSRKETTAALEALHREGANRPAPSSAEVAAFLSEQEWRTRFEPNLTEAKRQTVLRRLRAARGRLLPDAGTLYAWRHLAAECFARSRRKAAAVLLAVPLLMGLGACGNANHPNASPATSSPVATAPASPAVEEMQVDPATYSDDAVATFGQDRAEQGYAEVATVAGTYSLQPGLLTNTAPAAADFESVTAHMTPVAAADYRAKVQAMLGGDLDAYNSVSVATLYGTEGQGFTVADSGPVVTDHRMGGSQVTVDRSMGTDRLQVDVQQQATIHGTLNGGPATTTAMRTVTYFLTPSTSTSTGWQIDGWTGSFRVTDPVAAPSGR